MVQLLVALGGSPTYTRDTGATPFYIACEQGHTDVAQYLHEIGTLTILAFPRHMVSLTSLGLP